MQWTGKEQFAGFTDAPKPYHPLSLAWQTIHVENQRAAPRSHLKPVQQLVQLRQNEPFFARHFKEIRAEKYLYAFIRCSKRQKTTPIHAILINMFGAGRNVDDNQCMPPNLIDVLQCAKKQAKGRVVAHSCVIRKNSALASKGNEVELNQVCLYGREAAVLQLSVNIGNIHLPLS
jgi:hypothetical protein